jgi:hypothetical protein
MEPSPAEERAGEIGTGMANQMVAKIRETVDGFPASDPEQKSAIASLVAEGCEKYADELLGI